MSYDAMIKLIERYEFTDKEYLKNRLHEHFKGTKYHCQYVVKVLNCSYDTSMGYFKKDGNKIPILNLLKICEHDGVDIGFFLQDKDKIKEYVEAIMLVLENTSNEDFMEILGAVLIKNDNIFLGNLVSANYDPAMTTSWLAEECCYDEGNEEAGHIDLKTVFTFVEDLLNTADTDYNFAFTNDFVRRETAEEMKEASHSDMVDWYIPDEAVDTTKLIGFTVA